MHSLESTARYTVLYLHTTYVSQQHRGTEVVRWEEGKKWQKKVETLRTRLTEKQRELEGAHKSLQALKDTLTRSDSTFDCVLYVYSMYHASIFVIGFDLLIKTWPHKLRV